IVATQIKKPLFSETNLVRCCILSAASATGSIDEFFCSADQTFLQNLVLSYSSLGHDPSQNPSKEQLIGGHSSESNRRHRILTVLHQFHAFHISHPNRPTFLCAKF